MELDEEKIRNLAVMACLALDDAELRQLGSQLQEVLDHFARLSEIALPARPASPDAASPERAACPLRDDCPRPGLDPELLLAAAPAREDDFFVVPGVFFADGDESEPD